MAARRQSMYTGSSRRVSLAPSAIAAQLQASALIMTSSQGQRPVKQENSYKLEPDEDYRFQAHKAKEAIKDAFDTELKDKQYDPVECNILCKVLADKIKQKIKNMGKTRYKVVVTVTMGSLQEASANQASRCVWNDKFDNFAEYVFKNKTIYASGLVFGVYFE